MNMHAAGIDEVGRGALAGPVVVGAVLADGIDLLAEDLLVVLRVPALRDSKKLTRLQRERAYAFLAERIDWAVGLAEPGEVDAGFSAALRSAAGKAIDSLSKRPATILADAGLFHPYETELPTQRFVKGDESLLPIALASIMAKVWRDRLMAELDVAYPGYGFAGHVGYGTAAHYAALRDLGPSPIHRRSFLRA